jgi:membrane associated rhomboid family serine protease
MGIYDRDYYRREGPSFLESVLSRGTVCKWLIGINVACFLAQMLTTDAGGQSWFTNALILNAGKVMQGEVWRLLTATFLHSTTDPLHIVFNLLFLWWFGRSVEDELRSREFLAFYLAAAVLSSAAYVAAARMGFQLGEALGASGAVTAVLVLSACYNPRQVIMLFFLIPVPIWGFVVFMVAKDTFNLLGKANNGIGAAAHVGGAAFGFLYYKAQWRVTTWWPDWRAWRRRQSRPRLRLYREEAEPETPVTAGVAAGPGEDEQRIRAQTDAILEKISRYGKESLTESERELLLRASEVFKRRKS